MKRVRRLLAAMATLTLTATLLAPGASPVAAATPQPPASVPGIEPGAGTQSTDGLGSGEMPISPDDTAGTGWLNDCLSSSDAQDYDGRVYNRFRWCQEIEISNKYYKRENGQLVLKGTNTIRGQAAAIGYNNSRATRVYFRTRTGQVSYDGWNALEKRTVAPRLKLEITAECVPGSSRPTTASCGVGRSPSRMEWAQWSNFPDWVYWDVSSVGGEGEDKIAFHYWRFQMNGASPGYELNTGGGDGPSIGIRCDSGDYFKHGAKAYPHACIYTNAFPVLNYKMSENPQVGQHIRDAQNNPDSTWPTKPKNGVSKKIPGKWHVNLAQRGSPLHRVPSRYEGGAIADENEGWKKSACGQTGGLNPWSPHYDATTGLPPFAAGLQCDEYPFSSTDEGASDPNWDFSVRAVDAADNTSAGSKLRIFYTDNRILMFLDSFWVNVSDS